MVSTYIKQSTPNDNNITLNLGNIRKSHQNLTLQGQSELMYNLSDVGKFLPNIRELDKFDDVCMEIFSRKRKERQDSENLSTNECKLIRSNSEERTVEEKSGVDDNIRRVSSHEDFEKCKRNMKSSKCYSHGNNFPLRSQNNNLPSSNENIYFQDCSKVELIGEKYAKPYSQVSDHENSIENYKVCQKYNKSDTSPLRSSIHEYVLFPKRISPNRDPNVFNVNKIYDDRYHDAERDAENARSCERRSRVRRVPQRRGQRTYMEPNKSGAKHQNTAPRAIQESTESDSFESKTCDNVSLKNICNSQDSVRHREKSSSPDSHSKSPLKRQTLLDFTSLHEQLGQHEPLPSVSLKFTDVLIDDNSLDNNECEPLLDCNIVGFSKEISEIQNQNRIHPTKIDFCGNQDLSDADVVEPDERLQKISKKIHALKKKMGKFEVDFEVKHGYRASHADKMNDSVFRKLYAEMRKLKTERKNIKRGAADFMFRQFQLVDEDQSLKKKPMPEIMSEIEKRLEAKRWAHGRPLELEKCTRSQLIEEKIALQRALLWLEGSRGRPTVQSDRDSARPLYDRYRAVKQLVAGMDYLKASGGGAGELPTILEHETLPTVESPIDSPDKTSYSETDSPINSSDNNDGDAGASSSTKSTGSDKPILGEDKQDAINENLHCLSLIELNKLLFDAKILKSSLRSKIKDMEEYYDERNNRKMSKEEKNPILPIYAKYKETKARIRLLSALVNKQKKSY